MTKRHSPAAADLRRRPRKTDTLSFDCVTVTQGSERLALFQANMNELWDLVEINRRDPSQDKGYQRVLSQKRVDQLAAFIRSGHVIPTAIVVSFDEGSISPDGHQLTVPKRKGVGWIIDGQHRFAGAHESGTPFNLAVVAFINLSEDKQIEQFVTINREAKGVPSSLYLDLLKRLPTTKTVQESAKERAADIAMTLARDESSPFFGRITVINAPGRGELSLTNFVRKLAPFVNAKTGVLSAFTQPEQTKIIRNYFEALRQTFPSLLGESGGLFLQTIGFGAVMNALPKLFSLTLSQQRNFQVSDVAEILRRVDESVFRGWAAQGTGNAAEMGAARELLAALDSVFASPTAPGASGIKL